MLLNISSNEDVYKFSIALYDFLKTSGQDTLAESLFNIVDDCFLTEEDALAAHQRVFTEIRNEQPELPPEYLTALNQAINLRSED